MAIWEQLRQICSQFQIETDCATQQRLFGLTLENLLTRKLFVVYICD